VGAPLRSSFDPMDLAGLARQTTGVADAQTRAIGPEAARHQGLNTAEIGSPRSAQGSQQDLVKPSSRTGQKDKSLVAFRMTEDALARLEAGLRSQEKQLLLRAGPLAPASSDGDTVPDQGSCQARRVALPPAPPLHARNDLGGHCHQNRRLPPAGQLPMVPCIRPMEMAFRQDREVRPKKRRSHLALRSCVFVVIMLIATIAGTCPTSEVHQLETTDGAAARF